MDSDAKPSSPFAAPERLLRRLGDAGGLLLFAGKRFYGDNCFQTAASLTYTTLLAVVPLMTIGFAVFSAFPAFGALQNDIQTLIFRNLAPEIGDTLLEYVGAFMANAGKMPIFGVLGLAATSVLLIWTIEGAFSAIWRVHEPRSLVTRILSFWAIVSLGPLFAGASLSLSGSLWTTLQGEQFHGIAAPLLSVSSFWPLAVQMLGCALLYLIIPNRTVEWRDALAGGVVGSTLLEVSKVAFAWYMREFPAYQTIYGALATVPIFLFWLYVAWSTLLFGAVVTAAIPDWRGGRAEDGTFGNEDAPARRLALALCVLDELSAPALKGAGLRRRVLAARLEAPPIAAEAMLERLRETGWIAQTTRETWMVARDLAESSLGELAADLRVGLYGGAENGGPDRPDRPWTAALAARLTAAAAEEAGPLRVAVKTLLRHDRPADFAGESP